MYPDGYNSGDSKFVFPWRFWKEVTYLPLCSFRELPVFLGSYLNTTPKSAKNQVVLFLNVIIWLNSCVYTS